MTKQAKMPRRLPKYCVEDRDRHGVVRVYLRVPGRRKLSLPGSPWSAEFMTAYAAGIDAPRSARVEPIEANTWAWLCRRYFASAELKLLAPRT